MSWSKDYKKSIDCDNPKGFSQKAHCAARKKRAKGEETLSKSPFSEGTLHHWFKGSKSKSGKPGWVQADGSPCANEPGETKTPKCFSSARLKSLKKKGKKGESLIRSAIRRKRQKDKGQQAKSGAAKPTNVPTFAKGKKDPNYVKAEPGIRESMELNEAQKDKPGKGSGKKDACYHKVKSRYDVWPSAYASGALVKCRKVGAANWGTKSEEMQVIRYCPKCKKEETRSECRYGTKFWDMFSRPVGLGKGYTPNTPHPGNFPEAYDHEYSMARSELSKIMNAAKRLKKKMAKGEGNIEAWVQSKITKAADYIDTAADYVDSGEMNKESVSIEDANGNQYVDFIDIIKPEPLKPSKGIGSNLLGEESKKCWKGYKKTGTQELFGKTYNRCVKKEQYSDWRQELNLTEAFPLVSGLSSLAKLAVPGLARGLGMGAMKALPYIVAPKVMQNVAVAGAVGQVANAAGSAINYAAKQKEEENLKKKEELSAKGVQTEKFKSNWRSELAEDWQKVNRQDKTDGLSQKAVDAYRRENPGSKLQTAVTEKNPEGKRAKRRANFCRRMKGMKSKLTSAKTARDPDSRINKALRRWRCN
jgi:hypothetical protein